MRTCLDPDGFLVDNAELLRLLESGQEMDRLACCSPSVRCIDSLVVENDFAKQRRYERHGWSLEQNTTLCSLLELV